MAINVALVEPPGTITEAGTVSEELLLEREILEPPAGAASLSATVQVDVAPELRLTGLQLTDVTNGNVTSESEVVWELPFTVAVIVTVALAAMLPAVAVKFALVVPDAIVTDVGTLKLLLLLESVTANPPEGAGWLTATVHVELPNELMLTGLQLKLLSVVGVTVIEPPDPLMLMALPPGDAPTTFVSPTATTPAADGASVKFIVAIVPFCKAVVFRALTIHV